MNGQWVKEERGSHDSPLSGDRGLSAVLRLSYSSISIGQGKDDFPNLSILRGKG